MAAPLYGGMQGEVHVEEWVHITDEFADEGKNEESLQEMKGWG